MKKLFIVALFGVLAYGCAASIPMASQELDEQAKSFVVPEGRSNIYVNRAYYRYGSASTFLVMVDGRTIGTISSDTFHLITVTPGEHTVMVSSQDNTDYIRLNAESGKNYFLKVTTSFGWVVSHCKIEAVSETEGVRRVLESKRALSW